MNDGAIVEMFKRPSALLCHSRFAGWYFYYYTLRNCVIHELWW